MTAPPFQPLGLDHLLLHVRGMAEAEEFYCGVLGCAVKSRMPQWGMLELSAGVTLVDTADANGAWALEGTAPGRNLDHFAIATSNWDEAEMRAWLGVLDDQALASVVDLGGKDRFPLWQFLLHIITHSAQQRRDAVILLTNAGHPPPEIDFLYYSDWLRDHPDG